MQKYADIINLPHHVSAKHEPMSLYNRAAQFAPFAALSGHDDAIEETARLTTEKIQLSADEQAELDRRLAYLLAHIEDRPLVRITYFVPDPLKPGGTYRTVESTIKKYDIAENNFVLTNTTIIQITDISALESSIFRSIEL